jgi:hypothetical protein
MDKISDVTQELQTLNEITAHNNEELIGIGSTLEVISSDVSSLYGMLLDTSSSSLEERREQKRQNEQMLAALQGQPGAGGGAAGAGAEEDGGGGLLGGLGLAGAGLGIGAAGIGALFAGGGYLLNQIVNMDAEGLKQNILTLLSIPDEVGGTGSFFVEGGTFFVAMTGLGAGLAAFALGSGVSAAVNYFTRDSDFAQTVKDNVKVLLSIPDAVGGNLSMLAKGGAFVAAMTGLGVGLAAFGVGSATAGLADALTSFMNPNFAQSIKDNVVTLLSISDIVGGIGGALMKGGTFFLAMTGLATGLAVFGVGSGVAGIGGAIADFQDPAWAQSIKDNVLTLLSIEDALGGKLAAFGETGTFVAIMTGIGTGLAAFGIGKTAAAIADTISKSDWTQTIKQNVVDLLSITDILDGGGEDSKAGRFAAGMGKIAAGLLAFTGSKAIGQLANVGEKVLGFFGVDSPFDQIMDVADNSGKLMLGASAIEKIADALDKFGSIDVSAGDIDFKKLAKNLGRSIPLLRRLSEGGVYKPNFTGIGKIDFGEGLLDPSLRLDELAEQVEKINFVLGRTTTPPSTESLSTDRRPSGQLGMAAEERQALEAERNRGGGNGGLNVQNNSSTNVTNNSQSVVKPIDGPTRPPRSARDVQFATP